MFSKYEISNFQTQFLFFVIFSIQETQIPSLVEAGFKKENISWETMPIKPEAECKYYSYNQMIAPKVIKQ